MAILRTTTFSITYNKAENLAKIVDCVEKAGKDKVDLIVFPEGSLQGYFPKRSVDEESIAYHLENAETLDGEAVSTLKKFAKSQQINIVFGMMERSSGRYSDLYNTAVLIRPDGFVGAFRKVHLALHEKFLFLPGKDWPVFETGIGRLGLLICRDKLFPESTRSLALNGADILVMPTAWPLSSIGSDPETDMRGDMYDLLDRVRALENQCYFISSNLVGVAGEFDYYGHSRIVSPLGETITEIGYEEGWTTAEIDVVKELARHRLDRRLNNLINDRVKSTYIS
jgi:predicted amidohydrolase